MSDYLDTYKQIATGHPDDSYEPGTSKQRVDLTEYYKETQQDEATIMVSGIEAMQLGKFSKAVAVHFKLANHERYDPFPSERNARAGQEGFFTAIKDGFKAFIENIIKYIRMAVDWVVDTVKGIFGFRKSTRINKAINDDLGKLKQEFVTVLSGLGFPASEYNLENFLMNLPPNQDRVAQLTLLKSKFETDQASIDALVEAMPLLNQCIGKLATITEKVSKSNAALKVTIGKEYTKTRVRAANPALQTPANMSPELNRITKEISEVAVGLDVDAVTSLVSKLYEVLYNIKFSNDELQNGFSTCRKRIQETVVTEVVKLQKQDVPVLLATIQALNTRYIEITENTADLSKINFKGLAAVVEVGEADKVHQIAGFYNYPQLGHMYQAMAADVRNFSQFCYSVSQSLLVVERQAANLVSWYNRAHAYYYNGLLGEVEKAAEQVMKARQQGHAGFGDSEGYAYARDMVFMKDADARTFGEKNAAVMETIIKNDFGGVKTTLNQFSKQTGWGNMV